MRKVDYQILAEAIKKHRESAIGYIRPEAAEAVEAVARTFARFAHVDKAAFLRRCGILTTD